MTRIRKFNTKPSSDWCLAAGARRGTRQFALLVTQLRLLLQRKTSFPWVFCSGSTVQGKRQLIQGVFAAAPWVVSGSELPPHRAAGAQIG